MNKQIRRSLVFFGWVFVIALLAPNLEAVCSCTSPVCFGNYCYCCSGLGSYCFASKPVNDPCEGPIGYGASEAELAAFKARIDDWSQREDLREIADVATDLYNSVLFQDNKSFVEASDKLQVTIASLSEEDRKTLILSEMVRPE